jgi:hypothetical protein
LAERFCSGSVLSRRAEGVHDNHLFDPEADNKACAVTIILSILVSRTLTNTQKRTPKSPLFIYFLLGRIMLLMP